MNLLYKNIKQQIKKDDIEKKKMELNEINNVYKSGIGDDNVQNLYSNTIPEPVSFKQLMKNKKKYK